MDDPTAPEREPVPAEPDSAATTDKSRRDRARLRARKLVRIVAGVVLFSSVLAALASLGETFAANPVVAWLSIAEAVLIAALGLFLLNRPMPTHPVGAVIGAVLAGAGGVRAAAAAVGSFSTWLVMRELFPDQAYDFLLSRAVPRVASGLLPLAVGLWATVSASPRTSVPTPAEGDASLPADEPSPDRDGHRARRLVRIVAVLVLLHAFLAVVFVVMGEPRGVPAPARTAAIVAVVETAVGLFLITRPTPKYPLQAMVGAILTGLGGIGAALGWVGAYAEELPPLYAPAPLVAAGAQLGKASLVALSLGVWATFSATSHRRRQHTPVVLYEPEEEEATIGPDLPTEESGPGSG